MKKNNDSKNSTLISYYKIIFTINNPENIKLSLDTSVKYAIWQLEEGKKKGIKHIQGCLEFYRQYRLKHVKNVLGNGDNVHIERIFAKSFNDAIKYCSKEDTRIDGPWEFYGQKQSSYFSNKEKEVEYLKDLLKRGITDKELVNSYSILWIKYKSFIRDWRHKNHKPFGKKLNFEVYFGDSGTGKTTRAKALAGTYYIKPGGRWFCNNYEGQETIILDEIDKLGIPFHELLKLIDGSITSFETKGGFAPNISSKNIVATSNKAIEDWFMNLNEIERGALFRRVDKYLEFRFKKEEIEGCREEVMYRIDVKDRTLELSYAKKMTIDINPNTKRVVFISRDTSKKT